MEVLRTPDERFEGLPDFAFAPNYVSVSADLERGPGGEQLRVHYLDEGPRTGRVVLLMHGEPSWCFLYRKMIPTLVAAGFRCIAPDLVGFGRSDKPTDRAAYTYAKHVEWMRAALFEELDLRDITLVCQDWGGLIGLRLVGEHPDRFARVVAANTFLPTGDQPPGAQPGRQPIDPPVELVPSEAARRREQRRLIALRRGRLAHEIGQVGCVRAHQRECFTFAST